MTETRPIKQNFDDELYEEYGFIPEYEVKEEYKDYIILRITKDVLFPPYEEEIKLFSYIGVHPFYWTDEFIKIDELKEYIDEKEEV